MMPGSRYSRIVMIILAVVVVLGLLVALLPSPARV
jgi:hypothetical protein